jgi:leucyl aminopeptidase
LALSIAKKDPKHLTCKVFGKKEAEKLGMEAFLGIARAVDAEPKFIVLEYTPDKMSKKEKLALVGKGITFDSGGINVKTGDGMIDMKCDMSGAAIVLGVFSVISKINPSFPVLGIVAATPNLISGTSLVPGDVVKAMNGKTIEVLNTDAEGRVTMADSLSYAVKEKATKILDFATLTGACMVALGTDITGLLSNNKDLAEEIKKAASAAGEKMWELPLEKDYKELNKSEVADIANIPNTRYGGTITAALFLEEFVDNTPWVHLDIAGPAFLAKPNELGPKGGTGHGVRTVLNLLS